MADFKMPDKTATESEVRDWIQQVLHNRTGMPDDKIRAAAHKFYGDGRSFARYTPDDLVKVFNTEAGRTLEEYIQLSNDTLPPRSV